LLSLVITHLAHSNSENTNILFLFIPLYIYINYIIICSIKIELFLFSNLLVFILQKMSSNVPDYIFTFHQQEPLDDFIDNFINELKEAETKLSKTTIDDVKLAQELRKAEAYVKELTAKCEIASKQRIKAKEDFDAVYAKVNTALANSNA